MNAQVSKAAAEKDELLYETLAWLGCDMEQPYPASPL